MPFLLIFVFLFFLLSFILFISGSPLSPYPSSSSLPLLSLIFLTSLSLSHTRPLSDCVHAVTIVNYTAPTVNIRAVESWKYFTAPTPMIKKLLLLPYKSRKCISLKILAFLLNLKVCPHYVVRQRRHLFRPHIPLL
uniref:Secreted protein n=1 Tax=Cacopsylla melanoneura TaxID=428564 RepID=A0A8D8SJ50_9HEMI